MAYPTKKCYLIAFCFLVLCSLPSSVTPPHTLCHPYGNKVVIAASCLTRGIGVLIVGWSSCVHLGPIVGINIIRLRLKLDQKFIFVLLSTSTHFRFSHPNDKWS